PALPPRPVSHYTTTPNAPITCSFAIHLLCPNHKPQTYFPQHCLPPPGQQTNPPLLVLKPRRGARLPQQTRQWSASAPLPPFPALWLHPLVLPGHAQDRGEAAHRPAAVPPRPTRRRHRRLRFEGRGLPRLRRLSHLHRSRLLRPDRATVGPLIASLQ